MAVSLVLLVGSALFLRSFRARLDIDPGVGSAPAVVLSLQEPEMDPAPGREAHGVDRARVSEGFFDAAAVRIVDGRPFDATDALGGNPVAIVSEAFARKFWPGESAIGRTMRVREQEVTVVGVVISAFGTLALVLASIGLFGVVSYAVSTREREVGIRMAMGADAGRVVRLMMRGGLQLVAIGVALGLALSAAWIPARRVTRISPVRAIRSE